jgi:5-methylcytosine-specific restriction protein B
MKEFNKIYYGAPGTGKSYNIKKDLENVKNENIFRIMFHEEYSFFDFVGQYKPVVSHKTSQGSYTDFNGNKIEGQEPVILYHYMEGIFLKSYIQAYKNLNTNKEPVYLIIEELNRGNCSSIFGDIFQLLDRDSNGNSDYPIKIDNELKKYLEYLNIKDMPTEDLILPSNLFLIATMNTSDQSLFPIDSAFKRRWHMEYVPISYNDKVLLDVKIENYDIKWLTFLEIINEKILMHLESENKLIGQWFLKNHNNLISENDFKNKLLHYLFFDVFKHHRNEVFNDLEFSKIIQTKSINDIFK